MANVLKGALQALGVPLLLLTAYGLDSWRLSPAVLSARELLRPTIASQAGAVLPQVLLAAATLLLGWYLLIRSRPSVWVSAFYGFIGAYLLAFMPAIQAAMASGGVYPKMVEVIYYPCSRFLMFLPMQVMLQFSFAVLLVLGIFGMLRWFAFRSTNGA